MAQRVEKTVFISYRRSTGTVWALAVSQNLTHHGYDVFFDYQGIASGDFEQVIVENIKARAHFVILLTPSALERIKEPGDWLRREIETAIENRRNIVPLMLEGFDFASPSIVRRLAGSLEPLKKYNGISVPVDYFDEAMDRLRSKHLNIATDAVLHPASTSAQQAARAQRAASEAAPTVQKEELTAEQWFERGFKATDPKEKIAYYTESLRIRPEFATAHYNRGHARMKGGDIAGAIEDFSTAIRLNPAYSSAYINRGACRKEHGDVAGAIEDFSTVIRLNPDDAMSYKNRGIARNESGDTAGALEDYSTAIRLDPNYVSAYYNRGRALNANGDIANALEDYSAAIRLNPNHIRAYYNRAEIQGRIGDPASAIADYQRYLDLGGGQRDGDQAEVEARIRKLRAIVAKAARATAGARRLPKTKKAAR